MGIAYAEDDKLKVDIAPTSDEIKDVEYNYEDIQDPEHPIVEPVDDLESEEPEKL